MAIESTKHYLHFPHQYYLCLDPYLLHFLHLVQQFFLFSQVILLMSATQVYFKDHSWTLNGS